MPSFEEDLLSIVVLFSLTRFSFCGAAGRMRKPRYHNKDSAHEGIAQFSISSYLGNLDSNLGFQRRKTTSRFQARQSPKKLGASISSSRWLSFRGECSNGSRNYGYHTAAHCTYSQGAAFLKHRCDSQVSDNSMSRLPQFRSFQYCMSLHLGVEFVISPGPAWKS